MKGGGFLQNRFSNILAKTRLNNPGTGPSQKEGLGLKHGQRRESLHPCQRRKERKDNLSRVLKLVTMDSLEGSGAP